ncbi:DUF302 domain-containing protein [Roseovarius spongiae]|uniref:DUF302 domain-containing protein n=1 Tax=Roseovarius spongiae TaxID=2320272 RepID=A0A3A8AXM7_9RHOB|nr:DUF302 domain-containing protein [Roseovarius spongiae]RKF14861.1 DUF302 domain-containing protein [Roseovarius spongiae]
MKRLIAIALAALMGTVALADDAGLTRVKAAGDVAGTMDALAEAVTDAGGTVFTRVDHALGAGSAGLELAPTRVLVFGNPKIGTPAMQDNRLAGFFLPLRVLVYEDGDGQTWLAYQDPKAMLTGLEGIAPDATYLEKMGAALDKLTHKAAGM